MRGKINNILRAGAFLLLFLALFHYASGVLRDKQYAFSTAPFYQESPGKLDVLFMGSSHMLNGVSPLVLWESQGIPSANLGQNGQVLPVTYYALREAFRWQKPEVVVVDVYKVVQDSLIDSNAALHFSLDHMRPGLPKLQAVFDLLPAGERAEYLWDIILYHTRWKELEGSDFRPADTLEKGGQALFSTKAPYPGWQVVPESQTAPPAQVQIDYLEKIVELCRKEDTGLLLVALPYTTPEDDPLDRQAAVNSVAAYAQELGVPFVNMMYHVEEMGLDFTTDMADVYHLNWRGMGKATNWLGEYLAGHWGLPSRRADPAYQAWEDALPPYHAYLEQRQQAAQASGEGS